MFGLKSKDMEIAEANILALMQGLATLNQRIEITNDLVPELTRGMLEITKRLIKTEEKVEENEKFVAECLTNNTILYDRINELDERMVLLGEKLRIEESDGTDF